jgi:hypothetical protein
MTGWLEEHFVGPVAAMVLSLLVGVFVPVALAVYRRRKTFGEVRESLSASEAKFRADLIVRLNAITERCDRLQKENIECERRSAELLVEVESLRVGLQNMQKG